METHTSLLGSIGFWARILIPPALLLPLFLVPVGVGSAIFWVVGVVAWAVSLVGLARDLWRNARRRARPIGRGNIRQVLVLLIVTGAFLNARMGLGAARRYGRGVAEQVEAICQAQGRCPDKPIGWPEQADGRRSITTIGRFAWRYHLVYLVAPDRQTFRVWLRLNIDSHLEFSGGVSDAIRVRRLTDG